MDMTDVFKNMSSIAGQKMGHEINIEEVMGSELGGVVNYGLWLETVEIQKTFNDKVAPGWQEDKDKYDFWMAILDEALEVLGSRHWKWWKHNQEVGEVDWDNVTVELVDIFHFILSIAIQNESQHILFTQLVNLEMNKDKQVVRDDKFFKNFWEEFLMGVQMKMLPLTSVRVVEYWYRSGGDAESLFMAYRIKAALNNIRQEFGYGTTYEKMWLDTSSGTLVEDNVIATKLSEDLELSTNTVKELEERLRKYYLSNVAV